MLGNLKADLAFAAVCPMTEGCTSRTQWPGE